MERIRTKTSESLAPIVSDFLRVGMWGITPISRTTNSKTGILRTIFRYGSGEHAGVVVVDGKLYEQDRGAFLIIRAKDKDNKFEGVEGKISDLVKMKGVKKATQPTCVNSMWDSVERLLDVHVRIKPNRRGGSLSAAFKLVSGYVDSDSSFFLTTGDYQKMIEKKKLYELKIALPEYFHYKSPITRSLKYFLAGQKVIYTEQGYEISLKKLCDYIGYDPQNIPMARIWQHIEGAINELKHEKFLSKKSKRTLSRNKAEGGIISFWAIKKEAVSEGKKKPIPPFIIFQEDKYVLRTGGLHKGKYVYHNEDTDNYEHLPEGCYPKGYKIPCTQ